MVSGCKFIYAKSDSKRLMSLVVATTLEISLFLRKMIISQLELGPPVNDHKLNGERFEFL